VIGESVKSWRKAMGLSQRQLAGGDLTRSYISMIECGKKNPSMQALHVIASRLGISTEYLQQGAPSLATSSSPFMALSLARSAYEKGDYESARIFSYQAMEATADEMVLLMAEHLHLSAILQLNPSPTWMNSIPPYAEAFFSMDPKSELAIPVLLNLGALYFRAQDYATARHCYHTVVRRTRGFKHLADERAHAQLYLGTIFCRLGQMDAAMANFEEAYSAFDTLGNRRQRAYAALGLSSVMSDLGDLPRALAWADASEMLFEQEVSRDVPLARHNKAVILMELNQLDGVSELLTECIEHYRSQRRNEKMASALEDRARYHLLRGNIGQALADCEQACELLIYIDDPWLLGRVYRQLGEIWLRFADRKKALEYAHVSALILRGLKMTHEYEKSKALTSALRGDPNPCSVATANDWRPIPLPPLQIP
jgi:transcriptional regulator with XRE-family HTH domain